MTGANLCTPPMTAGELIASITRMSGPGSAPDPVALMPDITSLTISSAGRAARKARYLTILTGFASSCTGVYLAAEVQGFWGAALFVTAAYMTLRAWKTTSALHEDLAEAQGAWDNEVLAWRDRTNLAAFDRRKAELMATASAYQALPRREREKIAGLDRQKRQSQLERHLRHTPLSLAKIRGIGPGRVTKLASHGIVTAWDLQETSAIHVPGIGPAAAEELKRWSRGVKETFVFNENALVNPVALQRIKAETASQRDALEHELAKGQAELQSLLDRAAASRVEVPASMGSAYIRLKQLETDLRFLGHRHARTIS